MRIRLLYFMSELRSFDTPLRQQLDGQWHLGKGLREALHVKEWVEGLRVIKQEAVIEELTCSGHIHLFRKRRLYGRPRIPKWAENLWYGIEKRSHLPWVLFTASFWRPYQRNTIASCIGTFLSQHCPTLEHPSSNFCRSCI